MDETLLDDNREVKIEPLEKAPSGKRKYKKSDKPPSEAKLKALEKARAGKKNKAENKKRRKEKIIKTYEKKIDDLLKYGDDYIMKMLNEEANNIDNQFRTPSTDYLPDEKESNQKQEQATPTCEAVPGDFPCAEGRSPGSAVASHRNLLESREVATYSQGYKDEYIKDLEAQLHDLSTKFQGLNDQVATINRQGVAQSNNQGIIFL